MRYFNSLIAGLQENSWGYNVNGEFSTLLSFLFDCKFEPLNHFDTIRVEKIYEMRDEWAEAKKRFSPYITKFPEFPTVLELLVSLSRSMEDIMSNREFGDRTATWFWTMIINLGLEDMDNSNFDQEYVIKVLERWLKREFEPDGTGSPFPLKHPPCDMTGVDIWRSFNWYMTENYQGRW